jgi:hypothetical protein
MATTEAKPVEQTPTEPVASPKPWEQEWVQKPVQAVTESVQTAKETVKEAVKGFKWPWEMDWTSKTPEPTQEANKAPTKGSEGFGMAGYIDKLKAVESSGKADAKAKTSTATGPYQFISKTWMDVVNKHDLPYTLHDRTDPVKAYAVVEKFSNANLEKARKELGRTPTYAELYMYHFIDKNASKLINAPSDAPAVDYVSKIQAMRNKPVFFEKDGTPKTAGQVMNRFRKKFGEAENG